MPPLGGIDPVGISGWNLYRKQERDGASVWWKLHARKFNSFWLVHPCDGQTDRQTDGQTDGFAITYRVLSMLSRSNKILNSTKWPVVPLRNCLLTFTQNACRESQTKILGNNLIFCLYYNTAIMSLLSSGERLRHVSLLSPSGSFLCYKSKHHAFHQRHSI